MGSRSKGSCLDSGGWLAALPYPAHTGSVRATQVLGAAPWRPLLGALPLSHPFPALPSAQPPCPSGENWYPMGTVWAAQRVNLVRYQHTLLSLGRSLWE